MDRVGQMDTNLLKLLHISVLVFAYIVGRMSRDLYLSTRGVEVAVVALWSSICGDSVKCANWRLYTLFWIQKHPTHILSAAQHFCPIKPFSTTQAYNRSWECISLYTKWKTAGKDEKPPQKSFNNILQCKKETPAATEPPDGSKLCWQ